MRTWNLLATLLLLGSSDAQSFTPLGSGTAARISDDGTTVVFGGWNSLANNVFRWDAITGTQDLGQGGIAGVSADGSVLWANRYSTTTAQSAHVWTQAGGWSLVPIFDPQTVTGAADCTADGRGLVIAVSVFCWSSGPCYSQRAYLVGAAGGYTQPGGSSELPQLASHISSDGTTLGGRKVVPLAPGSYGRRWTIWAGGTDLGHSDQVDGSYVSAIDASGARAAIAYDQLSLSYGQAHLWEASTSAVTPLQGGVTVDAAEVLAMSADGTTLVGTGAIQGADTGLVWTEPGGWSDATDYLLCRGVPIPASVTVTGVLDVSAQADAVVVRSDTGDLFHASLAPGEPYGWHASPVNGIELCGRGSTSLGGTFQAEHAAVPSSLVLTAISAGHGDADLFGGRLLIDPAQLVGPVESSSAAQGASTLSLNVPNDASLVGQPYFLQSASPNAALPGGWSLSNGLKVVIRS